MMLANFAILKLVLGFFCKGIVGLIREDDVIEERDVEDVAGLAELVRLVDVGYARGGSPGSLRAGILRSVPML